MKKFQKFLSLIAIVGLPLFSIAQSSGKISGSVNDDKNKGVESATVSLLYAKDSSVQKRAVANKVGRYNFEEISNGKYLLSVSAIGYSEAFSEGFEITTENPTIEVKIINLFSKTATMAGVIVTARKQMIEQKIDRTIVNVDASVSNIGATALEVLEKAPGVTVDKDGNISLKGKQGVLVMMDGRPSYLSGAELANYLKALPSSAIDQIEIMTNPSAKYDAAGNSGVINIKSKKTKQKGFNGSVTAGIGQGQTFRTSNSINLNYRTGKLNLFANAGVGFRTNRQQLDLLRNYKEADGKNVTAIFEQTSFMNNKDDNYNLKVGADYYLTKKTTIGVVTSGFINLQDFNSENTSYFKSPNLVLDSINQTKTNTHNLWKNGALNLNVRHQFDSTGREITTDLDYVKYNTASALSFNSASFENNWTKKGVNQFRGDLPMNIDIYSAKIDYAQPLKKEAKLEAGLKTSFVKTNNTAKYYNQFGTAETIDYKKTNNFLYEENIHAAYLNYNRQFKKLGVQAGLRYEFTSYKGNQYGNSATDSTFTKGYGNLFPTMFASYKLDEKNQFGLSFGRRLDRPAYQDLNPFVFYIDEYTYESGNPYLKPQFTNNAELSHTFKSFLTTTINYGITKDYINETFTQGEATKGENEFATILKKGNIGQKEAAGISISAQVPVRKWWNSSLYGNYNYSKYSGSIDGTSEMILVDASNLMFNMNNQLKFKSGWGAELSGFYRTKGLEGQIIIKAMGQLSVGVSKQVLKDKGSVKLAIRDIFLTNYAKGDIYFGTTEAHFINKRDSRVANLSFTYRFGKPIKGAQQRRKIGGADNETNRVKGGSGN